MNQETTKKLNFQKGIIRLVVEYTIIETGIKDIKIAPYVPQEEIMRLAPAQTYGIWFNKLENFFDYISIMRDIVETIRKDDPDRTNKEVLYKNIFNQVEELFSSK